MATTTLRPVTRTTSEASFPAGCVAATLSYYDSVARRNRYVIVNNPSVLYKRKDGKYTVKAANPKDSLIGIGNPQFVALVMKPGTPTFWTVA